MMSREQNVDLDDTEVGRVRVKLKKLMENQQKSRMRPKSGIRYWATSFVIEVMVMVVVMMALLEVVMVV